MRWFLSNLWPSAVAGIIMLSTGLILWISSSRWPRGRWALIGAGLLALLAAAVGFAYVAFGPPGQEETDEEEPNGDPHPDVPDSAIERLRQPWNSEARANWPVAETLAILSELAYLSPVEAKGPFEKLGFTEFMPVVQHSMIGYVVSADDVTVIVLRGSERHLSDWLINLGRSAADTPHGPIHSGFYRAYMSMKPQIDRVLHERETKHLWVTGHSLGGALALVCAYDLVENEKRHLNGVVTFGQPMVARQPLATHLDTLLLGRYARLVNGADVVARVPPSYAPCGSLVWFTKGGIRRSKPKQRQDVVLDAHRSAEEDYAELEPLREEEFEQLQADLRAASEPIRLPDGTEAYLATHPLFEDHDISLYVEQARKLLQIAEPE